MIGLCSVMAVNAALPAQAVRSAVSAQEKPDGNPLTEQLDKALRNRSRWLYDLMTITGKGKPENSSNPQSIYDAAKKCGIIDSRAEQDMYLPLNRRFVAKTLVKALGYQSRTPCYLADVAATDSMMSTAVYYGYFLPDVNSMVYPDAAITESEYDDLIFQLNCYRQFKGKKLLSFGDSIMYGTGNDGEGIADMFAEKYGMTADDYAVSGATMGICKNHGHIRDQVMKAAKTIKYKPDLILINGGTNDMNNLPLGNLAAGSDLSKARETTFTEGMEKTLWSLQQNWSDVPIIYIRVHNMDYGADSNERTFGDRALAIASKWKVCTADVFNNTDFNSEDTYTRNRYTYLNNNHDGCEGDSIHPNALGYAKYYLPLLSKTVYDELE